MEKSCGVILYTIKNGKRHYLLIQSKDGIVGFPKGHIEENESEKECAIRECKEETGIDCSLHAFFRKSITYTLQNGKVKEVVFFVGKYENQVPCHMDGFEKFEYLSVKYEQTLKLLTFDNLKIIFEEAEKFLRMVS